MSSVFCVQLKDAKYPTVITADSIYEDKADLRIAVKRAGAVIRYFKSNDVICWWKVGENGSTNGRDEE